MNTTINALYNESVKNLTNSNSSVSASRFTTEVVIVLTVHLIIFIFGSIGNILVAAVVVRTQSMHCSTNCYVFNLALSDLCLTMFNIPLANLYHFTGWPFGRPLCKYFLGAFGESVVGVSVFTHTALGLVRYRVVQSPMKSKLRVGQLCLGILCIWALSFASLSAPIIGKFDLVYSKEVGGDVCKLLWPSLEYKLVYRGCVFTITYVIPMAITTFCYVRVFKTLRESAKFLSSASASSSIQMKRCEYRSRRLTKALCIIYIIFAVTTLPLEIFYVLADAQLLPAKSGMRHVWSMLIAVFYSLTIVNPLMLFYMSEDYRSRLFQWIGFDKCCKYNHRGRDSTRLTRTTRMDSNSPNLVLQRAKRRDSRRMGLKGIQKDSGMVELKEMKCFHSNQHRNKAAICNVEVRVELLQGNKQTLV